MRRFLIFLMMMVMACTAVSAQQAKDKKKDKRDHFLYGSVYDSFTRIPLQAKLYLMDKDSTVLDTTSVDVAYNKQNQYSFPIDNVEHDYIVKAVCKGYEDCFQSVKFMPKKKLYYKEVPQHLMKKLNKNYEATLDEVEVKATRIQMVYRGDTIVYDASAFVLPEGSMIDDLIRQLPGAELKKDGEIYVQGKKVDYLTLNGKDLFKGNNKLMLENLPYFTVKDIKVFNKDKKKAEQAFSANKKEYVMDVTLKREYIRNVLSNVNVGAGSEERWMAKLFSLVTGESTDVMVYGNFNNLSDAGVPRQDGSWRPEEMDKGVKTNREVGVSVSSTSKDKKNDGTFRTIMRWNDEKIVADGLNETFASDGNVLKKSFSDEKNKYYSIRSNGFFNLRPGKIQQVTGQAYLSYDHAKTFSTKRDSTFMSGLMNSNLTRSYIAADYLYTGADVYMVKDLSSGDDISIGMNIDYSYNKPNDSFSLSKTHYATTGQNDVRNYYGDTHKASYEYQARFNYTINLPRQWYIVYTASYKQKYQQRNNFNYRLDWLEEGKYDELGVLPSTTEELLKAKDAANSYSSVGMSREYGVNVQISKNLKNGYFFIMLPVSYRHERFHYMRSELDTIAKRHNVEFRPMVNYSSWGKNNLNFDYSMGINQPDFADLMPYGDNTNPLSIHINNPDLKRKFTHSFNLYKRLASDSTDLTRWISLSANLVQNAWGTRTSYNTKTGAFTYVSDNVNGNWDADLRFGFDRTLDKQHHLSINASGGIGYWHSVDFGITYDDKASALSKVNTWKPKAKLSLTYHQKDFQVMTIGQVEGQISRSNLEDFEDINAYNFSYGGQVQYTIPGVKLTAQTDLIMFSRRGYNAHEMNTDDLIWNAQLTRSFWKGNIVAKLQAYDLLHQLTNKVYTVNAQGRTETWYNTIPRYVMFSLAFKLTKGPQK